MIPVKKALLILWSGAILTGILGFCLGWGVARTHISNAVVAERAAEMSKIPPEMMEMTHAPIIRE